MDGGLAVHWLRPKSKAPFADDWQKAPVYSYDELKRSYRGGYNAGVRLGEPSRVGGLYLQVADLDVRDPALVEEARARLKAILPEYPSLPTVKSGSGGASRHFYFLTAEPFRSKKLAHSQTRFFDPVAGRERWAWEIELFGTGKQVAIPPSIHPDTGLAYEWLRELDFAAIAQGLGPEIAVERVRGWAAGLETSRVDGEQDDLVSALHMQPMDLTADEIHRTLADLPLDAWCEDRDGWLNVGMALHHQFRGGEDGLRLWNEFSARSKKFDAKDQERVWRSFRITPKSMRFALLIRAANEARLADDLAGDGLESAADDDPLGFDDLDDDPIGDLADTRPKAAKPDLAWVSRLARNEEGKLTAVLPNITLIVRHDPRTQGLMAFNLFTQEVVQRGQPGVKPEGRRPREKGTKQLEGAVWTLRDPVNGDLWTEEKDHAIRDLIETPASQGGYGVKVSDRDLRAAIDIVARENSFHPVREYLAGLTWDGAPRLDTLFVRYLGAADTPYTRSVARLTLVGGVARVMRPGHKFDFATILEGLQGRRKSTFIKLLAKAWFSELDGDFHDQKQMVESMQGSWILEIPELSGFGRADVRQIKAFISRTADKVRLAYARRAQVYPRQCIFIGSTNDREYLRDDTGGRRFWPVPCEVSEIDTLGFAAEVDQLWAEATAVYRQMRARFGEADDLPLYLTDRLAQAEAAEIQEDRRVQGAEDALAGKIAAWLDEPPVDERGFGDEDDPIGSVGRDETSLIEIWVECLRRDEASYSQMAAQQIGRAMRRVEGWVGAGQGRTRRYGKQRIYRRAGAVVVR